MPVRYQFLGWDSGRWGGFALRPDDIVISAPSKCGTTWTQFLCALLIFDGELPAPLSQLSPWLDQNVRPAAEVHALYEAQAHRRFIKTHTPLDGIPRADGVTYLCIGRDPRDAAVSLDHHYRNMDLPRTQALRAQVLGPDPSDAEPKGAAPLEGLGDRLRTWRDTPEAQPENLHWILRFFALAWDRRHEPGVALFHYCDLTRDLRGELARLATVLGVERSPGEIDRLAAEATLDRMRARAVDLAPNTTEKLFLDPARFFRRGGSGEWQAWWDPDDLARYRRRVSSLVSSELAAWAHAGRGADGPGPR